MISDFGLRIADLKRNRASQISETCETRFIKYTRPRVSPDILSRGGECYAFGALRFAATDYGPRTTDIAENWYFFGQT
jgi:hypothetical protein